VHHPGTRREEQKKMSDASQGGTRNTRSGQAFVALLDVMDRLRDPGGCPWDREQTLESLRT